MEPKLEAKHPIPDVIQYPFARMRVGISFTRPVEATAAVKNAASRYKRKHPGWDYKTQTQDTEIRVWCTALPKTERT